MSANSYRYAVSVIIPTFNRPDSLSATLQAVAKQTYSLDCFEVIVVDDGSTESYHKVIQQALPFAIRYHRQDNHGEAIARNYGAELAQGELLVFLDDDMLIEPDYLKAMFAEHTAHPQALLIGTMYIKRHPDDSVFRRIMADDIHYRSFGKVPFTEILAGVLSVPRDVFSTLGGMQPTPDKKRGGWIDMDFAYRAHTAGYELRRCRDAIAYHDDYALKDLAAYSRRMYNVSRLAEMFFQLNPPLRAQIPMFRDKMPIAWQSDPLALIVRKLARRLASTRLVLWGMEQIAPRLEGRYPLSRIGLRRLYRWIIGAYIFRGYRQGLRELRKGTM